MKGILEEVEVFKYFWEKCDKANEEKLTEIMDAFWGRGSKKQNFEEEKSDRISKVTSGPKQADKPNEDSSP